MCCSRITYASVTWVQLSHNKLWPYVYELVVRAFEYTIIYVIKYIISASLYLLVVKREKYVLKNDKSMKTEAEKWKGNVKLMHNNILLLTPA